jgi:hypothetical protein
MSTNGFRNISQKHERGVSIASAGFGAVLGIAIASSPLTEKSAEGKISSIAQKVTERIDRQKLFEYTAGADHQFEEGIIPEVEQLIINGLEARLQLPMQDAVGTEFDAEAIKILLKGNKEVMLPPAQIEEIVTEVAKARNTPLAYGIQFVSMFLTMLMGRLYLRRKDSEASESNSEEATPNKALG